MSNRSPVRNSFEFLLQFLAFCAIALVTCLWACFADVPLEVRIAGWLCATIGLASLFLTGIAHVIALSNDLHSRPQRTHQPHPSTKTRRLKKSPTKPKPPTP